MRLSKSKMYSVTKFYLDDNKQDENMGIWNGADVRIIIGNAKYDETFGMFFPASNQYAFEVTEI